MKVFISWSGPKSKAVAQALHDWVPFVINEVQPFMSADSIESGQRWSSIIANELESTNFGIICTTASNQASPWLNFEAGALAKQIGDARVAPLAIDLLPSEIKLPLGQFNGDPLDLKGIRRLLHSMNKSALNPLDVKILDPSIDQWWPKLESQLKDLPEDSEGAGAPDERSDRDMLVEIVESMRVLMSGQARLRSEELFNRMRSQLNRYAGVRDSGLEQYLVSSGLDANQFLDDSSAPIVFRTGDRVGTYNDPPYKPGDQRPLVEATEEAVRQAQQQREALGENDDFRDGPIDARPKKR